jgi:hypothetical protein
MKTPLFITVLEDGTTAIPGRPEFPVDGDALHPGGALKQRARDLIAGNPEALASARAWLGKPLHSSDPELKPAEAAQLIQRIYPGGAPRFVADRVRKAA